MVSTLLVRVVLGGFGLIEFQYLYCAAFVIAVEEGWGAAAVDSGQPLEREGVLTAITGLGEGVGTGRGEALFVVGEAGQRPSRRCPSGDRLVGARCRAATLLLAPHRRRPVGRLAEADGDPETAEKHHQIAVALHEPVELPLETRRDPAELRRLGRVTATV
jgi:hypothetical protein